MPLKCKSNYFFLGNLYSHPHLMISWCEHQNDQMIIWCKVHDVTLGWQNGADDLLMIFLMIFMNKHGWYLFSFHWSSQKFGSTFLASLCDEKKGHAGFTKLGSSSTGISSLVIDRRSKVGITVTLFLPWWLVTTRLSEFIKRRSFA